MKFSCRVSGSCRLCSMLQNIKSPIKCLRRISKCADRLIKHTESMGTLWKSPHATMFLPEGSRRSLCMSMNRSMYLGHVNIAGDYHAVSACVRAIGGWHAVRLADWYCAPCESILTPTPAQRYMRRIEWSKPGFTPRVYNRDEGAHIFAYT